MKNFKINKNQTLSAHFGARGYIITAALIISFIFNILALTAPFTKMGNIFSSSISCTLPYSVYLMWIEGLYGIAMLIAGFSIMFPFVKLFILFYSFHILRNPNKRHFLLSLVEPLGKWSMLDVFATCIILILCNKQFLIYGTPMIGVNFFLTAIFTSMLTSIVLSHLHSHVENVTLINIEKVQMLNNMHAVSKIIFLLISLISLFALCLAIWYPYIQISSFFLSNYAYSIGSSIVSLSASSFLLAVFMTLTLVIFPLLHIIFIIIYLFCKLFTKKHFPKIAYLIKILSRFNMLDVFLLAFIIFISEGSKFISTDEQGGLYLICIFTFTSLIMPYLITGIKTYINYFSLKKIKNPDISTDTAESK